MVNCIKVVKQNEIWFIVIVFALDIIIRFILVTKYEFRRRKTKPRAKTTGLKL